MIPRGDASRDEVAQQDSGRLHLLPNPTVARKTEAALIFSIVMEKNSWAQRLLPRMCNLAELAADLYAECRGGDTALSSALAAARPLLLQEVDYGPGHLPALDRALVSLGDLPGELPDSVGALAIASVAWAIQVARLVCLESLDFIAAGDLAGRNASHMAWAALDELGTWPLSSPLQTRLQAAVAPIQDPRTPEELRAEEEELFGSPRPRALSVVGTDQDADDEDGE
jgi:hypothetical protein